MNSWGTEAAYLLAYDEATDTATLTVTFAEGDQFKIATAGWEKEFNSGTISAPEGAFGGSGNIECLVAGTYEIVIANVTGAATCTFTAK